jgi:predicted phage terminase large subunit-like protein
MSTRRNSSISARIVIQQRTHEGDVAGDIIEKGGYTHLNLPTEFGFAGGQRCRTGWTVHATGEQHSWEDPRTEEGELLNPARFGPKENEQAKIDLGDYQYAAQHGQNPAPPKGSIIQAQWLRYYGGPGQPPIPDWQKSTHQVTPMLSLDCSFKDHKDTDFVAGLGWAMFGADIYLMPICIHKRMNFPDTIDAVAEFVGGRSLDPDRAPYPGIYPFIKIKLVEDKANGSAVISTLQHRIAGMMAYEPGNANKESRLRSASWRFRAGNIYLPHESIAPWVKEYVYEICAFPKAKKDDYADATSQAILFIGGDGEVLGEPDSVPQESRWFNFDSSDLGGEQSIWGYSPPVGGRSKSIWRQ